MKSIIIINFYILKGDMFWLNPYLSKTRYNFTGIKIYKNLKMLKFDFTFFDRAPKVTS